MQEEWQPIEGFDGYEVSNLGRVISYKKREPRLLVFSEGHRGHKAVGLFRDSTVTYKRVHSLVAAAFIGPRPPGAEVRHLDGDPENNCVSNLVYGTSSENSYDSVRHGTHVNARKTECPQGHPYDEANTQRVNGRRWCRTCRRDRARAARHAKASELAAAG